MEVFKFNREVDILSLFDEIFDMSMEVHYNLFLTSYVRQRSHTRELAQT